MKAHGHLAALAVFALAALVHSPAPRAEIVEKVVAVVNERVITLSELRRDIRDSARDLSQVDGEKALDEMIDRILLDQQAFARKISVTDAEVETSMKRRREDLKLDEKSVEEELRKQNMTEKSFFRQWKYQLLSRKLLDSSMQGSIAVTEKEIEEHHREHYGEEDLASGERTRIAHVLIAREREDAAEVLGRVMELARGGEPFENLAAQYSMDEASAQRGGDLGYFAKGDLVPELESAAAETPVGEIAGPVETGLGYHVIKVLERSEDGRASASRYRNRIRQEIYMRKVEEFVSSWLSDLRENSYVETKL